MNLRSFVTLVLLFMIATLSYGQPEKTPTRPAQIPAPKATPTPDTQAALSIHGNQEQPTVLYIVPWQDASDQHPLLVPSKPLLKQVFQQVERSEHERTAELNNPALQAPAP